MYAIELKYRYETCAKWVEIDKRSKQCGECSKLSGIGMFPTNSNYHSAEKKIVLKNNHFKVYDMVFATLRFRT